MSDMQAMSHESSGLCWCGPNNHGPEPKEYRIEWTGNIKVYQPIKKQANREQHFDRVLFLLDTECERAAQRFTQRGEAITFYREIEERRAV
jgi:hypothetical protein